MEVADEITLRAVGRPVDRTVRLPGSKSLTNRALLVAALAGGTSPLEGVLLADDTRLMIEALRALGIGVQELASDPSGRREAAEVVVEGRGGYWPNAEADLFCGNAGTAMRFLTAACAIGHGEYRLDGVPRMRARPIGDLVDALRSLGAPIEYEEREGYCPLRVHARGLRGGTVRLESPPSSQFVSALLMAAPYAARDVMIDVAGALPSEPYVGITLRVMEAFGAAVVEERCSTAAPGCESSPAVLGCVPGGPRKFIVPARQTYRATRYRIEPDASAAAYFLAAAALTGGRVTVEELGAVSCQGDARFVEVLERMGCRVDRTQDATTVWGPADGRLRGIDVDLNAMPDTAPTLAVLAAFAEGPTRIRNVGNLRIKETDRLAALAAELRRMGVETTVHLDEIEIRPAGPPKSAVIETYDDHRMAMSFALAGLRVDGLVIRNPRCVSKTFPGFFELWAELGR
jgi:3-phosphoshikimate 1-carboxyvinyltransferase